MKLNTTSVAKLLIINTLVPSPSNVKILPICLLVTTSGFRSILDREGDQIPFINFCIRRQKSENLSGTPKEKYHYK